MKIVVLVDNKNVDNLKCEWGLSIYIELNDKKILLDGGSSNKYIKNAKSLGIDLSDVDYFVLSHAHYDHSTGIKDFCKINKKAKIYISSKAKENCYKKISFLYKYIGIPKRTLSIINDRVIYVDSLLELCKDVYLLPHYKDYSYVGKNENMYTKENHKFTLDDFSHEESLVIKSDKGLVVFNSCSHVGIKNIAEEIKENFDEAIYAVIGGMHLHNKDKGFVEDIANTIKSENIKEVYTGHCTGDRSYKILKDNFDNVTQFYSGLKFEI